MVSLTCSTESRDGVTLVTGRLDGGPVAQRVRVANRLDGPVWPPRRRGVPEAGWDDDGFEGVVLPGETVALGYASPAPPADRPLELAEHEVVNGDAVDDAPTPAEAVRELGDPSPPRDAVPVPTDGGSGPRAAAPLPTVEDSLSTAEGTVQTDDVPTRSTPSQSTQPGPVAGPRTQPQVPDAVADWLAEVERRVALAERLTDARSVPAATTALREAGSLDAAAEVVETVEADGEALSAVAERATDLGERADATDVPIEALRRLA